MEEIELNKIKETVRELLQNMTMTVFEMVLDHSAVQVPSRGSNTSRETTPKDTINISVTTAEPQMLIGQNGQTLLDLSRLLRMIIKKKTSERFVFANRYQ